MDLIRAFLKSLACCPSFEDLCGKPKAGKPSPHIVALRGKRVALVSEAIDGLVMNERLFKNITGNEELQGRACYKLCQAFTNVCRFFMACNHLPHFFSKTVSNDKVVDEESYLRRICIARMESFFSLDDLLVENGLALKLDPTIKVCLI